MKFFSCFLTLFFLSACVHTGEEAYKTEGERIDDRHIVDLVKSRLHHITEGDIVHVAIDRGIVQLSGFVETENIKKTAGRIVFEVPGVTDVINDIIVRTAAAYRKERATVEALIGT